MAAKPVLAWRVWRAIPDGFSTDPRGLLYGALTGCRVPWRNGWAKSACLPMPTPGHQDPRPHRSPGVRCECGIRGDTDLEALLAYGSPPNYTRWNDQLQVIGEVELYGRTAPRRHDDTPTTLRAERARVGRTVYFPQPLWSRMYAFEQLHSWSRAIPVRSLSDVLDAAPQLAGTA